MRASVRSAFLAYCDRFEGTVDTPYTDVKNLVTIARGNLIDQSQDPSATDPAAPALVLPFERMDGGGLASIDEIRAEWGRVKNGGFAHRGWKAAAAGASIFLPKEAIDSLDYAKLDTNDAILRGRFDGWEALPAAVQLAIHSMGWACGTYFRFPRFQGFVAARDWGTYGTVGGRKVPLTGAILECHLDETDNAGLVARNAAQVDLFAAVIDGCGDDEIPGWG